MLATHRYPLRSLTGDYLRAGLGAALGLGVLLTVPPSTWVVVVFGGIFAVFALFALRTLQRQLIEVAVSDAEIRDRGFGRREMAWSELSQFKLRFYGTRRQREQQAGFMQLKFKGAGASFSFESNLEGFDDIAWRAARAARDNGVTLDSASLGNLKALGFDAEEAEP